MRVPLRMLAYGYCAVLSPDLDVLEIDIGERMDSYILSYFCID